MKRVVSVTMGSSKSDFSFEADFLGEHFQVQRLGADGNSKKAWELLRRQQASADAIGLGEVADHCHVGTTTIVSSVPSDMPPTIADPRRQRLAGRG